MTEEFFFEKDAEHTLPETNSSPPTNSNQWLDDDDISFWDGYFQRLLTVSIFACMLP